MSSNSTAGAFSGHRFGRPSTASRPAHPAWALMRGSMDLTSLGSRSSKGLGASLSRRQSRRGVRLLTTPPPDPEARRAHSPAAIRASSDAEGRSRRVEASETQPACRGG